MIKGQVLESLEQILDLFSKIIFFGLSNPKVSFIRNFIIQSFYEVSYSKKGSLISFPFSVKRKKIYSLRGRQTIVISFYICLVYLFIVLLKILDFLNLTN